MNANARLRRPSKALGLLAAGCTAVVALVWIIYLGELSGYSAYWYPYRGLLLVAMLATTVGAVVVIVVGVREAWTSRRAQDRVSAAAMAVWALGVGLIALVGTLGPLFAYPEVATLTVDGRHYKLLAIYELDDMGAMRFEMLNCGRFGVICQVTDIDSFYAGSPVPKSAGLSLSSNGTEVRIEYPGYPGSR